MWAPKIQVMERRKVVIGACVEGSPRILSFDNGSSNPVEHVFGTGAQEA